MSELVEKLFAIHDALSKASLPHAFGGAIALAFCVEEPRGTRDLDVNVFVPATDAERVLAALPPQVTAPEDAVAVVKRDGQARLDWDGTPIDVFLNNQPFHTAVSERVVWVPMLGREVPVIDCASLVVFKSLFDRTKDWGDIEAVVEKTPAQCEEAAAALAGLIGEDDPSYRRLRSLLADPVRKNPRGLELPAALRPEAKQDERGKGVDD